MAEGAVDTLPASQPAERLGPKEVERLSQAARLLRKAEKPVRILRAVAWPPEVAERFMAAGGRELPQVSYTPLDPTPIKEGVAAARALVDGTGPVHDWLRRIADVISTGADMLATLGTPDFHLHSVTLYG